MKIKLKYLSEDVDRYGNVRCYVRIPGKRKARMRSMPGSTEFMEEYAAAIESAPTPAKGSSAPPGSFRALCVRYFGSASWGRLDAATRLWQRHALEEICAKHGDKPVRLLQGKHIRQLRDEREAHPSMANKRLKALRAMFRWALEADTATHDPTVGVRSIRYVTKGHHSWTPDEVVQFEDRHKLGTRARLAFDLLIFTTGRREDAVRFGPQHVRDGRLRYRQAKNEDRNPVDLDIPVHPDLAASIAAAPSGHLTYLVTEFGKPFSPNGFGNLFKDYCRQADLPHCSAHGLRKATAARLAEAGATPHEIAAITGHRSLSEIERYTRAAQRAGLADRAMKKLER